MTTDTASAAIDTLEGFLNSVNPKQAAKNRWPNVRTLATESFGHPNHSRMLQHHDVETARFARRRSGRGDAKGGARLREALAEARAYTAADPTALDRWAGRGGIPDEAKQFQIAMQALQKRSEKS